MFWVFSKQQGQLQEGPEPQGAWPPQGLPCCTHLVVGPLGKKLRWKVGQGHLSFSRMGNDDTWVQAVRTESVWHPRKQITANHDTEFSQAGAAGGQSWG